MQKQSFTIVNVFDKALKFFVFSQPIVWLPGIPQKGLQILFFIYGSGLLFALGFCYPAQRDTKNYFWFFLLAISSLTSLITFKGNLSLDYLNIALAAILYFSILRNVVDVKGIIKWMFICVGVNAVVATSQLLGYNPLYSSQEWYLDSCGLMARDYHLAFYVAFLMPLFWHWKKWAVIPLFVLLFYLNSYIAIGSAIFSLMFMIVKSKKIVWGSIPFVFGSGLLFLRFNNNFGKISYRLAVWGEMIKESFANPILGSGLGSFNQGLLGMSLEGGDIGGAYNQVLKGIYELGLVPMILVLLVGFKFYKSLYMKIKSPLSWALFSSLISIFIISCFHEILQFPRLAVSAVVILALFEAQVKEDSHVEN